MSAVLGWVRILRAGSLKEDRVPAALGESFAFSWLRALFEARFPASTYDVRIPLGPGQALHQEIRDKGDGRYSVWHGTVYFSLPPGVPLARVHRLDLVVPRFLSADSASIAKEIDSALAGLDERESFVVAARFGLLDGREHTLAEVGTRIGLTRERIRQIERDALAKLRAADVTALRDYAS